MVVAYPLNQAVAADESLPEFRPLVAFSQPDLPPLISLSTTANLGELLYQQDTDFGSAGAPFSCASNALESIMTAISGVSEAAANAITLPHKDLERSLLLALTKPSSRDDATTVTAASSVTLGPEETKDYDSAETKDGDVGYDDDFSPEDEWLFPSDTSSAMEALRLGPEAHRKMHEQKASSSRGLSKKERMQAQSLSKKLKQLQSDIQAPQHPNHEAWRKMQRTRQQLPAAAYEKEIVQAVADNQCVLISGETGCGKTTQIPQFLLNDAIASGKGGEAFMVCTQPRRLAAMGVASRVADERVEKIGDVVGYQIRGEKRVSASTRLVFCTTGVLLRQLQRGLGHVTHVIVDEVHERSLVSALQNIVSERLPCITRFTNGCFALPFSSFAGNGFLAGGVEEFAAAAPQLARHHHERHDAIRRVPPLLWAVRWCQTVKGQGAANP